MRDWEIRTAAFPYSMGRTDAVKAASLQTESHHGST